MLGPHEPRVVPRSLAPGCWRNIGSVQLGLIDNSSNGVKSPNADAGTVSGRFDYICLDPPMGHPSPLSQAGRMTTYERNDIHPYDAPAKDTSGPSRQLGHHCMVSDSCNDPRILDVVLTIATFRL